MKTQNQNHKIFYRDSRRLHYEIIHYELDEISTIGMSLAASIVGYVNPTDDQRVPRLQPVEVKPVTDAKG